MHMMMDARKLSAWVSLALGIAEPKGKLCEAVLEGLEAVM